MGERVDVVDSVGLDDIRDLFQMLIVVGRAELVDGRLDYDWYLVVDSLRGLAALVVRFGLDEDGIFVDSVTGLDAAGQERHSVVARGTVVVVDQDWCGGVAVGSGRVPRLGTGVGVRVQHG